MRVAGPNPLTIKRMKTLDERLPITDEQYQALMGSQDTLKTALADGRLYLTDYSLFDGALNGSFPAAQKFNYAPLALFAVPRGRRSLVPVAIQCGARPGSDNPMFLPRDGDNWLIAKTIVQIADTNVHQAASHLGLTHLFIELLPLVEHRVERIGELAHFSSRADVQPIVHVSRRDFASSFDKLREGRGDRSGEHRAACHSCCRENQTECEQSDLNIAVGLVGDVPGLKDDREDVWVVGSQTRMCRQKPFAVEFDLVRRLAGTDGA